MAEPKPEKVTVTINDREVIARPGELLIEVAERAGSFVPRFCYHPRLEPVGICRMCLVEVEGPRGGTLQPACYLSVTEGMVVHTETDKVKKAQDGVLEFLLANHPLDCPVCDKGGECPLQDQTLSHGSGETRYVEEKRHFAKPISIGELVLLDRERCIQCARCTRFAAEVAGEATIDFAGRGDQIEVAPFPTEPFDSYFSGNTVQICPVGALTAKPYRFRARPWDLEQVESTCQTCAVGCRIAVQSSGGRLTRVLGVDSDPVNRGWLCDKGRFALDLGDEDEEPDPLSPTTRLRAPLVRQEGVLVEVGWSVALERAATILKDAAATPGGVGMIGGAALTNEGAYAFERLMRGVLRTDSLDCQYGDGLDGTLLASLPIAEINDLDTATAIITICGDLREELPVLFLRVRAAVLSHKVPLVELAAAPAALDAVATVRLAVRPGETHLMARALVGDGAATTALATHPNGVAFATADLEAARQLLGAPGSGVVVIVGRANVAEDAAFTEEAVRALRDRLPGVKFLPALRRGNVIGALDMGLAPGLRPGRSDAVRAGSAEPSGRDSISQLRALAAGDQSALLLVGGTLTSNVPDVALATAALDKASIVAVTGHGSPDLALCEVVLPVAINHERHGTTTNIEGRVSALAAKVAAPGSAWDDVAVANGLADAMGRDLGGAISILDAALEIESTTNYPAARVLADHSHEGYVLGRPGAPTRPLDPIAFPGIRSADLVGLAPWAGTIAEPTPLEPAAVATVGAGDRAAMPMPTVALADAYSLRVVATKRLYDYGSLMSASPWLTGLVAEGVIGANPYDLDRLGATTGHEVRIVSSRGSFTRRVVADPMVTRGTLAVAARGNTEDEAQTLVIDAGVAVVEVRMESL
jgi:NADH-quinone oxidoreductase subunit G